MEIWKLVQGHPDYEISSFGRIKSKKFKKHVILKQSYNLDRYKQVRIYTNKKGYTVRIHRLVAENFIDNPNNLPCVDHINKKKDDNRIENLRWVSKSDNCVNRDANKNNKIGHKNIREIDGLFIIRLMRKGKPIYGGHFYKLKDAIIHRDNLLKLNIDELLNYKFNGKKKYKHKRYKNKI